MNRCIDCEKASIELICPSCKRKRLERLQDAYERVLEEIENPRRGANVPA
jgi:hypothetical protein